MCFNCKTIYFYFFILKLTSSSIYSQISLPPFFSDHMVLQQGEEITIWGKASPKEEITGFFRGEIRNCLLYTSPSPRDGW